VQFDDVQHVVVKPNLVDRQQLAATHIDALRAVFDFVRARYDGQLTLAEGAALDNTLGSFSYFGFDALAADYGVDLVDLNADAVVSVQVHGRKLEPITLRLARTIVESDLRISVGPPKTHDAAIVTCSIKNMVMGTLVNRMVAKSVAEGPVASDKTRPSLLGLLDRLIPYSWRFSPLAHAIMARIAQSATSDKFAMHQGYATINLNLANLAPWVWPHLVIVDGFQAMEGAGPVRGDPVDWRLALAGTDPLAVDSLTASLMGFDPAEIGYLSHCRRMGLGEGDLAAVQTVGNVMPDDVARVFRPHPAYRHQKAWHLDAVESLLGRAPLAPTGTA
jgi:uncharacterized protein (DUF362 family)